VAVNKFLSLADVRVFLGCLEQFSKELLISNCSLDNYPWMVLPKQSTAIAPAERYQRRPFFMGIEIS
jgi:hypothetical protein